MQGAATKTRATMLSALMALACTAACLVWSPEFAHARSSEAFARTLPPAERKLFEDYLSAKATHDFKSDAYWRDVSDKKALRRARRGRGEAVAAKDYVRTFPPKYTGPELSASLAKRWAAYQEEDDKKADRPPPKPLPGLSEFIEAAESEYDFRPERIPEQEFKLRYAREAISLGLTGEQVVRVYALETSGLGTADMVAGIHPIRKTGKPISSAIGYAQLLTANTSDELAKHGPKFLARLKAMAADRNYPAERRRSLAEKHDRVAAMVKAARSIPHKWNQHVAFARTRKGMGLHALNIDGDVGPWLQVIKLHGLKEMAEKQGIPALKGAEIELMNLAGPGTGLEMMRPAALNAATTNFFARDAYYRNTIVRDKSSVELLKALDERMDQNMANPGAIEFVEAFRRASSEIARR